MFDFVLVLMLGFMIRVQKSRAFSISWVRMIVKRTISKLSRLQLARGENLSLCQKFLVVLPFDWLYVKKYTRSIISIWPSHVCH